MVKSLKFGWLVLSRLMLLSVLALLALGLWLYGGERSLDFAKPWVNEAINAPDAPMAITIGAMSVDWQDWSALGKIRLHDVRFTQPNGDVFAQLPELYATLDPLGFLPSRRLLHHVIIPKPRLYVTRMAAGDLEFGLESSPSRVSLSSILAFFGEGAKGPTASNIARLPFSALIIDKAHVTFRDEPSATTLSSDALSLRLSQGLNGYDALLAIPFVFEGKHARVTAGLRALRGTSNHVLSVQLSDMPSDLICALGQCGEDIRLLGPIHGRIAAGIDPTLAVSAFRAALTTTQLDLRAPKVFETPLVVRNSAIDIEGDWKKGDITLTKATLNLEDTTITGSAVLNRAEDGWYVKADAQTTRLEVDKIYKYWPLVMAPDSRKWITNKLKSGYAASGKLTLNLTPADMAAEFLPDEAVDAVADARDITFEYLPGFPLVKGMNGIAHFTGTTVRVKGGGGTTMDGTKIMSAELWCPKLHSARNPMEATIALTAPASDAAGLLALKHFTFDDAWMLDPATLRGSVDATMKLKFNAFSENPSSDPSEIHLEAVDYDIAAKLSAIAQPAIAKKYDLRGLNGALHADTKGIKFDGDGTLAQSGGHAIQLSQQHGGPLKLLVTGKGNAALAIAPGRNDFALTYQSGAVPEIELTGTRLDVSSPYGHEAGNSASDLLTNFPAMTLKIDLAELILSSEASLQQVVGTLHCTSLRCESAAFTAMADKAEIRGSISRIAGGVRQLLVTSSHAGSMLAALDVTDRMKGGALELRGTYDDRQTPAPLKSRLIITDFTLKNSQILGRILSIGSLTGLANALTGSGILFDKLAANIHTQAGKITVSKGVANGNALGITVEGTLDAATTKLMMKGVVVPAYALNSMLGKIPLIGALAGGEGEGLIAFNYSVDGPYDNPEVGVNPLSGLTPGFLRGIFGIFDEKSDTPKK